MDETLKRRLVGVAVLSLIVLVVAWWLPDRDDGQKRLHPDRLPTETRVYDIHALEQRAEQGDELAAAEAASPPNVDPESEVVLDNEAEPANAEQPAPAPVLTAAAPSQVPKPSTAPSKSDAQPARKPEVVNKAPKPEPKPAPKSEPEPVAEQAPAPKPEPKPSQPLPSGDWIVQVGSYSKQENADAMRKKLEKNGYRVSITSSEVKGRVYHRVRVGPYGKKSDALNAGAKLEKLLGQKVAVLKNS